MTTLFERDPVIAKIKDQFGLIIIQDQKEDNFQFIVKTIVEQMFSKKAARTILDRLSGIWKDDFTPEKLYSIEEKCYRCSGLSKTKTNCIKSFSEKVLHNEISLDNQTFRKNSEISRELQQIKGIGPWTVKMYLLFKLNRPTSSHLKMLYSEKQLCNFMVSIFMMKIQYPF